jgi:hypothetical protein
MSAPVHEVNLSPDGYATPIKLPDCYIKIAEIAFYKAESRNFEPSYELDNWIEAVHEFNEMVAKNPPH